MNDKFEGAFDAFLDRKEYDEAESALFSMVRTAFMAGWKAAGGEAGDCDHGDKAKK